MSRLSPEYTRELWFHDYTQTLTWTYIHHLCRGAIYALLRYPSIEIMHIHNALMFRLLADMMIPKLPDTAVSAAQPSVWAMLLSYLLSSDGHADTLLTRWPPLSGGHLPLC